MSTKIRFARKPGLFEHPLTLILLTAAACAVDFTALRGTIAGIGFLTSPLQVTLVTIAISMFLDIVIGCIVFDKAFRTKRSGRTGSVVMAFIVIVCVLLHLFLIHFGSQSDTAASAAAGYMQTAQPAVSVNGGEMPLSEKAFRSLLVFLPFLTTMLIGILSIHRKDYELNHRIEKYETEIEMIDVFTQRMNQFVDYELDDTYDKARMQLSVSAEASRVRVKKSKENYRHAVADACPYANTNALFRNQFKPTPTRISAADPAETGTLLPDSSSSKQRLGTASAAGLSMREESAPEREASVQEAQAAPANVPADAADAEKAAEPSSAEAGAVITDVSFGDVKHLAETPGSTAASGVEPDE